MTALQIFMILALATPLEPDPVDERASAAVEQLLTGDPVAAGEAVGDDQYRNMIVLKVRDRLVTAFEGRDEETDQLLAVTFSNLVAAALDGHLTGQAQGEALMWSEALWERYIGDLDDGHRVDMMLGAVLRELGALSPGGRVGWARRVLDRTGFDGLSDAALGSQGDAEVAGWIARPDWHLGAFLYGVMDAWAVSAIAPQDPAAAVSALTPHLESRLLLDRLLAIQGLKRIGTPAARVALDTVRAEQSSLWIYFTGHTVGSQAALALVAAALVDDLDTLRVDLVAAKMDTSALERLRWSLLTDLGAKESEFTTKYDEATRGMRRAWAEVKTTAGDVRRSWIGLLRTACRREVDSSPEAALMGGDPAWRGRAAEACLERLAREAEIGSGAGPVFSRDDALAGVGLALKARERVLEDRVFSQARAYLRAVVETAYETPMGREEIDGLVAWTMDDPATAAVVRRLVDVAFERALADGNEEGPDRDGAPGLLKEELELYTEFEKPEQTALALMVGIRWHLLWRDVGGDERSIHQETAWARFDAAMWETAKDLRSRMRTEAYAREILEDLARDDGDVAALRWALSPEDRLLVQRIRSQLLRASNAASRAARRTTGIPQDVLDVFLSHYPVLDEIAMIWLAACFGERPETPAPAGLTRPKPPKNPMDLRRAGPPPSAYSDVVHGNYDRIKDCYDERRKRRPGLEGTLIVEVEISTMGNVAVRIADDGLGDEQVAMCVLRTIRRLDFPFPKEKVHVFRVPFQFTP